MPRGRALWATISVPMLLSLVAMNYHFVGDVVAGSVLGGIIGAYAAALAGLAQTGLRAGEDAAVAVGVQPCELSR